MRICLFDFTDRQNTFWFYTIVKGIADTALSIPRFSYHFLNVSFLHESRTFRFFYIKDQHEFYKRNVDILSENL